MGEYVIYVYSGLGRVSMAGKFTWLAGRVSEDPESY